MPKIPSFIKQTLKELEDQVKDVKELKNILSDPNKIAESGKKCADAKKFKPVDCYEHIYGKDSGKA